MKQITVDIDGKRYSLDVEEVGPAERMRFVAKAPDELTEADSGNSDVENIGQDTVDYMVDVTTSVTELDETQLKQFTAGEMIEICVAVINAIFEGGDDTAERRGRVKRVRLTQHFITQLFRGEMTLVAGLPDDAVFEEFNYDPAHMELQFIFSSSEWEKIPEGAEVPVFEATGVEISSSTKEL